MAEPGKQQIGDGQDNYGKAANEAHKAGKNIGKGIKNAGKKTAEKMAKQGTDAAVRAASATVQAVAETGKAVGKIAAGTAAGGPWGAAISAAISLAWAMRHTLFKILICICLVLVILIACIVSLPNIIYQNITDMFSEMFGFDQEETVDVNTFEASYEDLASAVEGSVQNSYAQAVDKAWGIISNEKYDKELSRGDFSSSLGSSFDYDTAHFLSAYSVSMEQNGISKSHFINTLDGASNMLFTVVVTEKTAEVTRKVNGEEKTFTVTYVVCSIERYTRNTILDIFSIDKDTEYKNYGITKGEYVDFLAESLKKTLAGVPD
jgi:hypothetical protein